MTTSETGDAIKYELAAALDALDPTIEKTRDYLHGFEEMYRDDPIILRDLLWRCLDSMTTARGHVYRAEWYRMKGSQKRRAALERERKKRTQNNE